MSAPAQSPEPKPSAASSADDTVHPLVLPAVIAGVAAVVLVALFWSTTTAEYRSHTLGSFLAMVVIVIGALLGAMAKPRDVGHGLAALFGLASLGAGLASFSGSLPTLLSLVLITMGAFALPMAYQSYAKRSRPAWAFLAAILGVMGVCTLFGAPKVRSLLDVNMWIALMVPGLLAVATAALGMVAGDYRETRSITPRR